MNSTNIQTETTDTELPDDLNPKYMFSCIPTELLTQIVKDEINPKELAWTELRNRGLDLSGKWVGFGADKVKRPF